MPDNLKKCGGSLHGPVWNGKNPQYLALSLCISEALWIRDFEAGNVKRKILTLII